MDLNPPEDKSSGQSFQIVNYEDGFFEPSGEAIECPFSQRGLEDWNKFNLQLEGKLFGVGHKLLLPDELSPGQTIVFGRDSEKVDVVIDSDIIGDYVEREMGVSRVQFALSSPNQGKWEIEDMVSTNGTKIYRHGQVTELKFAPEPWELADGDRVILGGGPGVHGRLIGFRYFVKKEENPCLIKFYAKSEDDLFAAVGVYQESPDLVGKVPTEEVTAEVAVEIEKAAHELVELQKEVTLLQQAENAEGFNSKSLKLLRRQLDIAAELGERFYHGDWTMAAGEIGAWLFKEGSLMVDDLEAGKNVDKPTARAHLVASAIMTSLGSAFN